VSPKVIVCAGGGGVGKTTTSAALAFALARSGERTLVVTVDPARRLANAMGVEIDAEVHSVHVEGAHGLLFALMPEPRRSTRAFVELLFEDQPEALERMLTNRVYAALGDALAGIHDLVSLMLVARAVEVAEYDYLVVDTAPSRYALDFVSYPGRLADLFEGRAVSFFANLATKAKDDDGGPPKDERGLIAWGKRRVEAAIGRILDPKLIVDLAGLFSLLALVRGRFASLARTSERLLLGKDARYVLVAAPTGSAEADIGYIVTKLEKLEQRPHLLLLNRADPEPLPWLTELERVEDGLTLPVREAVTRLSAESAERRRAGDATQAALAKAHRKLATLRLPTVEARDPSHVVRALADHLGPMLGRLG
jgi:anion-transporting  ArsA/GET3 family ATPase